MQQMAGWKIIRVQSRNVPRIAVSLPLSGFVFCVLWALYTDSEAATKTHCGAINYLPSVSAAIGGFPLCQFVWRICISLHALPRFAIALMYYRYLGSIVYRRYKTFNGFVCALNVLENIGLIGLTFVSSTDNYYVHEKFFIIFLISSTLYMILLSLILKYRRNIPPTELESKSLKCKFLLVIIYLIFLGLTSYTFVRHNNYCESGMYTLFALFEYVVILANMGFHVTAYWDFYDRTLPIIDPLLQRLL